MIEKGVTYDVPGLRAGIEVLTTLCESAVGLGVADLAERTGVNKHMVFRCLKTLAAKGWVSEVGEGPKYAATLVPFHYASKPVTRMDLVAAAEAPLERLREMTGECVYLGVLHDDMVMYLIHRDGLRSIRLGGCVGEHYWPHASAPGKVLVAFGGHACVERCIGRGLPKLTERTVTDGDAFRGEMARVVKRGYAVDDEEYTKGGFCYAAPVRNYTGRVVAAVGTTVLSIHYRRKQLVSSLGPRIQEAADQISTALGWKR